MKKIFCILLAILTLLPLLAGCGGGLSGRYVNAYDESEYLEFSGGKAVLHTYGEDISVAYTQKGDRLTITIPVLGDVEFTVSKDGKEIFDSGIRYVKGGNASGGAMSLQEALEKAAAEKNVSVEVLMSLAEGAPAPNGNSGATAAPALPPGMPKEAGQAALALLNGPKLNLPLIIKNKTVAGETDAFLYVKNDNTAWRIAHDDTLTQVMENVRSVEFGARAYFLITNNNELWAYGANYSGQLGDNTGVDKTEPVSILSDVANVYILRDSVYALKTDRSLWVWGNNAFGSLTEEKKIFAPMKLMEDVVDVKPPFAITSDGSMWAWNASDAITGLEVKNVPTRIMADVADYYYDGFVLKGDASLWELKYEQDNGGTRVTGYDKVLDNVSSVVRFGPQDMLNGAMPTSSNYAITKDGALYAWGVNSNGQLGDGTKIDRKEPVKISDGVKSVTRRTSMAGYTMYILKTDGTLLSWTHEHMSFNNTATGCEDIIYGGRILKGDGTLQDWTPLREGWITRVDNVKMMSSSAS